MSCNGPHWRLVFSYIVLLAVHAVQQCHVYACGAVPCAALRRTGTVYWNNAIHHFYTSIGPVAPSHMYVYISPFVSSTLAQLVSDRRMRVMVPRFRAAAGLYFRMFLARFISLSCSAIHEPALTFVFSALACKYPKCFNCLNVFASCKNAPAAQMSSYPTTVERSLPRLTV